VNPKENEQVSADCYISILFDSLFFYFLLKKIINHVLLLFRMKLSPLALIISAFALFFLGYCFHSMSSESPVREDVDEKPKGTIVKATLAPQKNDVCIETFDSENYPSLKENFRITGFSDEWDTFGVEKHIALIFAYILSCIPEESLSNALVLDIGSNAGFFTYLSASFGFHVELVEPQKRCHEIIENNLQVNGWTNQVKLNLNGIGQSFFQFSLNPSECSTGFSVKKETENNAPGLISTITLDDIMKRNLEAGFKVPLVKCDTEGSEVGAILGGKRSFENGDIENFLVEVVPSFWEGKGITFDDGVKSMEFLIDVGYQAILLEDVDLHVMNRYKISPGVLPKYGEYYNIPKDAMRTLLNDRLSKQRGMNIWFRLESSKSFYDTRVFKN